MHQKITKALKIIGITLLAVIYISLFANAYMCVSVKSIKHTYDDMSLMDVRIQIYDINPECIIVPGCGIINNERPTRMMADRVRTAVELYNAGYAPKLLFSGDHSSDDYNEVEVMKNYAMALGVPEEDIILDHEGFSTIETMYRAKEVFGINSAIVVTQEYHLARSLYLAREAGINVVGVEAVSDPFEWQLYYSSRELAARVKDVFASLLGMTPKYN